MIGPQVSLSIHIGGLVGSIVSWSLSNILQIIELVDRTQPLRDGVSFLALNYSFERLIMLTFINCYVLESINTIRGV